MDTLCSFDVFNIHEKKNQEVETSMRIPMQAHVHDLHRK